MAATRPVWKGQISFGLVNIPITLYSAEKRSELKFRMLDSRNHARVRYERVNEETGEEVPWGEIIKGYEYDDGNYVLLTDEDFQQVKPESSQTIELEQFVDAKAIDYVYFDKPYYLVPGKRSEKGYVLLRETLRRSGKIGIARVVIRSREHLAALLPEGDALVLDLMRYPQELRRPEEFELPRDEISAYKVSDREIKMAEQLVDSMSEEWNPEAFRDDYRERLLEYIDQKVRQPGAVAARGDDEEAPRPTADVIDLMELLKQSVEKTGKKPPAKKPAKAKPAAAKKSEPAKRKRST
jgi:DNA end-binding protein Ku